MSKCVASCDHKLRHKSCIRDTCTCMCAWIFSPNLINLFGFLSFSAHSEDSNWSTASLLFSADGMPLFACSARRNHLNVEWKSVLPLDAPSFATPDCFTFSTDQWCHSSICDFLPCAIKSIGQHSLICSPRTISSHNKLPSHPCVKLYHRNNCMCVCVCLCVFQDLWLYKRVLHSLSASVRLNLHQLPVHLESIYPDDAHTHLLLLSMSTDFSRRVLLFA